MLRRWYVFVAGALLLAVGAGAVILTVPTNYQASGQVLLLPPTSTSRVIGRTNPYLELPDGLTFTASLVASGLSTLDAERDLIEAGFTSAYSIVVPPQAGPILVVTAKDTDGSAALAMRDELLRRVEERLTTIQDDEDTAQEQRIVARPFNASSRAEVLAGSKIRAFAMIGGLIILLTVMTASIVDRRASPRRRSTVAAFRPPSKPDLPKPDVEDTPEFVARHGF